MKDRERTSASPKTAKARSFALPTVALVSLTGNPLRQPDVWRMIRRRALAAGIKTEIGCHTFRATGITAYLKNGRQGGDGAADGRS